jgi:hypothetical protein
MSYYSNKPLSYPNFEAEVLIINTKCEVRGGGRVFSYCGFKEATSKYKCNSRVATSGRWESVGKGCRRENMVEIIMYACMQMEKWNYSRSRGRGIKKNDGGGEFKYE